MTFVTCDWTQLLGTSKPRTLRSRVCYSSRPIAALDPRRSSRVHQQNIQIMNVFVLARLLLARRYQRNRALAQRLFERREYQRPKRHNIKEMTAREKPLASKVRTAWTGRGPEGVLWSHNTIRIVAFARCYDVIVNMVFTLTCYCTKY